MILCDRCDAAGLARTMPDVRVMCAGAVRAVGATRGVGTTAFFGRALGLTVLRVVLTLISGEGRRSFRRRRLTRGLRVERRAEVDTRRKGDGAHRRAARHIADSGERKEHALLTPARAG
jgi:hypothetical protein